MKIAFVHDWEPSFEQEITWRDGLAAAIKLLGQAHEVKAWCAGPDLTIPHPFFPIHASSNIAAEVRLFNPDVILCWGDCTRPNAEPLSRLEKPMALCFAGGDPARETNRYFQHFFVESSSYKDRFEARGQSVSLAFGTNTDLYKPIQQPKLFDAINFATFAAWKRHHLLAEALEGLRVLCAGYMYSDHEQDCWKYPQRHGLAIAPHLSGEAVAYFMNMAKVAVIPSMSSGGSQRTVLEAMACNIPVVVCEDSEKLTEYVRGGGGFVCKPEPDAIRKSWEEAVDTEATTRQYILDNWSHEVYAKRLEEGLLRLLA